MVCLPSRYPALHTWLQRLYLLPLLLCASRTCALQSPGPVLYQTCCDRTESFVGGDGGDSMFTPALSCLSAVFHISSPYPPQWSPPVDEDTGRGCAHLFQSAHSSVPSLLSQKEVSPSEMNRPSAQAVPRSQLLHLIPSPPSFLMDPLLCIPF